MKNISKIDSNFAIKTTLNKSDIKFYNATEKPFKIHGVFHESGYFRRMPESIARTVSEGVFNLHTHATGGRVRFKTDSNYVAICAKLSSVSKFSHMTLAGTSGFDLYVMEEKENYINTFIPSFEMVDGYESVIDFNSSEMREITINFPLYCELKELYIGLCESATVCSPNPYKIETPIVYYGSSITQGGCASRPGNSYQGMISRRLNADYINLGFSGNAKGEDEIADYISGLSMSAFVYDYDYNAPTQEHLRATHEKMFKKVRSANPDLPIIILSRPKFYLTSDEKINLEIIKTTYRNALESGDKNVYFLDGKTLMQLAQNDGNVDNCHPNDLGFASMAKAVGDILEKIFN